MATRKKQPNPKPANKQPLISFNFTVKKWRTVRFAAYAEGLTLLGESIQHRINNLLDHEHVEIDVPLDCVRLLASACANHNVSAGIAFKTAASSYQVAAVKKKPVDTDAMAEAVANVKEELEGMET